MIYKSPASQGEVIQEECLLTENFFDEIDKWKTHNQNHSLQVFKSNSITDEEYDRLQEYLKTMKSTEDYKEYKKAFDKLCNFCHVVPRGVIIKSHELKKGEHDKNSFKMEYTYNTKKIALPIDSILYHISKVPGIKNLIPTFRGKSAKGYLYEKPRIYFTIRKHMPKVFADYKPGEKTHTYVCMKKDIRQVYVDPLVWNSLSGAVYIETNKPVPVEELDPANIEDSVNENAIIFEESEGEPIDFDEFFKFVTENGIILDDEEND